MKKFLQRYGKAIIKAVLTFAVAVVAYILAHKVGTAERGYEAIGGEIFIPFIVVFATDIWEAIKAPFKVVKSFKA